MATIALSLSVALPAALGIIDLTTLYRKTPHSRRARHKLLRRGCLLLSLSLVLLVFAALR